MHFRRNFATAQHYPSRYFTSWRLASISISMPTTDIVSGSSRPQAQDPRRTVSSRPGNTNGSAITLIGIVILERRATFRPLAVPTRSILWTTTLMMVFYRLHASTTCHLPRSKNIPLITKAQAEALDALHILG